MKKVKTTRDPWIDSIMAEEQGHHFYISPVVIIFFSKIISLLSNGSYIPDVLQLRWLSTLA